MYISENTHTHTHTHTDLQTYPHIFIDGYHVDNEIAPKNKYFKNETQVLSKLENIRKISKPH